MWRGGFRFEHIRERFAGWDLHPLESAAFSRRTPLADLCKVLLAHYVGGESR
jgi:hypothetical protein